jgi:Alpha/beta hydrolase family
VVPDLRSAALTGDPMTFANAAAAADVSGDDVVVVGHSGAGSVLPIVAAAIPTVVRTVFVDAGMPPCDGVFRSGGEFLDTLRALAIDGVLPVWARWSGEGVMEMLVPDDARRRSIEQELPTVPLAFFEAPVTAPAGWCGRSAAFVLLSEPYRSDAERARSLRWTVVERLGTHLDVANDEEAIAGILERIG